MRERPMVGILGGMGPEATADLYLKIIQSTSVKRDQDHLHVVIDSRAQVPDRTGAIFGEGESPVPELTRGIELLVSAGARLIAVPCNTAHYYHEAMQRAAGATRVLHMMQEVAAHLSASAGVTRVGLLATTGTVRSRLYHEALADVGLEVLVPDAIEQQQVMTAIYDEEQGIKVGRHERPRELLLGAAHQLVGRGADAIVAGCTEIPLALRQQDLEVPYVDATRILAQAVVREARYLEGEQGGGQE